MSKPLTAASFDATFDIDRRPPILWGLSAIGWEIGRSPDWVHDHLINAPGTPVRRAGRRYYAMRSELRPFMATQYGQIDPDAA